MSRNEDKILRCTLCLLLRTALSGCLMAHLHELAWMYRYLVLSIDLELISLDYMEYKTSNRWWRTRMSWSLRLTGKPKEV